MADEQIPTQTPAPAPPVAPATPSFQDKLKMDAKSLWNDHKLFFIVFGVLVLIVKFRDILIDILVSSSKSTMEDAKKEDAKLSTQENQAKADADKAVQDAKDEPAKQTPVTDDWFKKS
jgi:zona occludens toxin (predicted ATPase)